MDLRLDDGTRVTDLRQPPQGLRHRVLLGVEESSGHEVAVKIELVPGALAPERRALERLSAHDGPAPRLLAIATVAAGGCLADTSIEPGALCLVSERLSGEPPRSPAAWERLGRALARLARLPWEGSGLEIQGHQEFLAVHAGRVEELGRASGSDLGARLPAVPPSYADSPLTVTHGDPGPGNFLDDGVAGKLIDWEDVQVAPRGLDLGRAAFIALLGSGPEGYVAEDEAARAAAVVAGYRAESGDGFPAADELAWWLAVAGVQFAHWRLERAAEGGVPSWREAVAVLDRTLEDDARLPA
jgi:aminoglycoside phosphotransferase (APT) family kinase protein